MILVVGEVLIDRFPAYRRIGGAPLNFAVHLRRLGQSVRLVSRIGKDDDGRCILEHFQRYGLYTDNLQVDDTHITGCVDVSLDNEGIPSFKIVAPAAYDFIDFKGPIVQNLFRDADMVYFGSLAQRTPHGFDQISRMLKSLRPETRRFCDINLRKPYFSAEVISFCLREADILKLNDDELSVIGRLLDLGLTPEEHIARLQDSYRIETLALTHGEKGSTVFYKGRRYESPKPRRITVRDTVGAGDAFAAVFAAGILMNRPVPDILTAATDMASFICGQPGALSERDGVYEAALKQMGVTKA